MIFERKPFVVVVWIAALAGCASQPLGPTVGVMPPPGKPFTVFAQEQDGCKIYAQSQIGGAVQQADNSAIGAAALGTILGAGLGAAVGGGRGAAVGAASGVLVGSSVGANNAAATGMTAQQLYDDSFAQCMYSKGNQVPGFAVQQNVAMSVGYDPGLVTAVQAELRRRGWLGSNPDGLYGPHTRSAIIGYEQSRGLPADGAPSDLLLADLRAN